MLAELRTLKQLRLRRQWTWEQLAEEMNRVLDPPISMRTLHHTLTYTSGLPRDKTLRKIRRYLAAERRRAQARQRRRQAAAETVTTAAP